MPYKHEIMSDKALAVEVRRIMEPPIRQTVNLLEVYLNDHPSTWRLITCDFSEWVLQKLIHLVWYIPE